jgi:hypothetical protein
MKFKSPNYLYPLATTRQLQWTKQVVRGEKSVHKALKIKSANAPKKEIMKNLIKDKSMSLRFGKPMKTRNNNPFLKGNLPKNPMVAPDPRPGNAMHISPSRKLGYM